MVNFNDAGFQFDGALIRRVVDFLGFGIGELSHVNQLNCLFFGVVMANQTLALRAAGAQNFKVAFLGLLVVQECCAVRLDNFALFKLNFERGIAGSALVKQDFNKALAFFAFFFYRSRDTLLSRDGGFFSSGDLNRFGN